MKLVLFLSMSLCVVPLSAEQLKFSFLSPVFNGIGYSSHVLTVENQETTRKAAAKAAIQAAIDKAKADQSNTNLAKFLNNLESRIYAQISTNVANAMFAPGSNNSGAITMEGNTISWTKDDSNIYLVVTDIAGTTTKLTVPLGSFTFPGVGTP